MFWLSKVDKLPWYSLTGLRGLENDDTDGQKRKCDPLQLLVFDGIPYKGILVMNSTFSSSHLVTVWVSMSDIEKWLVRRGFGLPWSLNKTTCNDTYSVLVPLRNRLMKMVSLRSQNSTAVEPKLLLFFTRGTIFNISLREIAVGKRYRFSTWKGPSSCGHGNGSTEEPLLLHLFFLVLAKTGHRIGASLPIGIAWLPNLSTVCF